MPPPAIRIGSSPRPLVFVAVSAMSVAAPAASGQRQEALRAPPRAQLGPRGGAIGSPDHFITWPRSSPPLWASVWMLTYHLPARRSAAWASVRSALPLKVLDLASVIGTTTPAFLPGSAGPWKWPAVAGPLSPE